MDKANQENHPNEDIGHDSRGQAMSMHGHSSVPEQGRKRPCIWSCNGGPVHKRRRSAVSPVCRRLADDVDDEDDFSGPEVTADPEHDECKDKEVIEDEVGGYIGSAGDERAIVGEEVPDIADLR